MRQGGQVGLRRKETKFPSVLRARRAKGERDVRKALEGWNLLGAGQSELALEIEPSMPVRALPAVEFLVRNEHKGVVRWDDLWFHIAASHRLAPR